MTTSLSLRNTQENVPISQTYEKQPQAEAPCTETADSTANKIETKQLDLFMVFEVEDIFGFNNKFW